MPLTLVTGPANAAKAGEVLGGLRARVEEEPILVVPAFQDVEHAQRELAERGAVFGVSVLRFDWLFREIARRAGYAAPVASDVQRELIVEEAVRGAHLELLAESAAQPPAATAEPGTFGASAGRAGELRDELRVERIDDRQVRVARWVMRPNRGWELQQAPVMLPPKRFSEALAAAARKGVLSQPEGALASGGPGE